jgi:hypothetical protein
MGKEINIIDDLMAPSDTAKILFRGMNPSNVLGMIPDLLKNTMKISSKDILETDMRWDVTNEVITFYGVWMGKRTEDRWSKTLIRVLVQGDQHSKEKTGMFNMQIKGTLETKYNYANFFQHWFWFFYNRQFYHDQRRKYIDEGKTDILDMKEEIQSRFGIEPRE